MPWLRADFVRRIFSSSIAISCAFSFTLPMHGFELQKESANGARSSDKLAVLGNSATAPRIAYPQTARGEVTDKYGSVTVTDPYRWLEDTNSEKTKAWVEEENAVTGAFLDAIPGRQAIKRRLTELWNFERVGVPMRRDQLLVYTKNDGLQNQAVLYAQDSPGAKPRVLLDPNKLSADGTVSLTGYDITSDGKILAYGLSTSGSDWQIWKVMDIASGKDLTDELHWLKNTTVSWLKDGSGFFYSRFDEPPAGKELTDTNYFQKVFFHKLGASQALDKLVYERKDDKELGMDTMVTEDGRYLLIVVEKGTSPKNGLVYKDLTRPDSQLIELFPHAQASYNFVGNEGNKFFVATDRNAPRGKVIAFDVDGVSTDKSIKEVIKQSDDTIENTALVDHRLLCGYMKDARSVLRLFKPNGEVIGEIALPGMGRATQFSGRNDDKNLYFGYTSFNAPYMVFHYDLEESRQDTFFEPKCKFNKDDFTTEQIFFKSKDGTRVPMFVSHKKSVTLDGRNPALLYGYGGFKISLTPFFSVSNLLWMERGGVLAIPNLRGGGEYGEGWHESGMKEKKQNVFDDFIAAAETLIDKKYTSSDKLAIAGGSNGGLLVGACLTQRPDLYGAALPDVGVMDMLRFNKFTVGWSWVQEYGSPDEERDFPAIYKYSPLHHIKPGTCYPPTLITTSDHDDRVVPGHSFKFAAALQAAQSCDKPVLIRIETKAGHGAGKSTEKMIAVYADAQTFLTKVLHMDDLGNH